MSRLSFAVSMSSLGALVIGIAAGCGTNEKLEEDDGAGASPGVIGGSGNSTGGGGRGAGGRGAVGGSGGGGPVSTTPLGKTCLNDTDCGEGLFCALTDGADFDGGGPAGGVCTADCSIVLTDDQAANPCSDIDENAVCVQMSDTVAYCFEGCFVGPTVGAESKCHKRNDMACFQSQTSDIGFCQPVCRGDFECKGRKCDYSRGVCMDELEGSLAPGAKCDPDADPDICQGGICITLGSSTDGGGDNAYCSGICRVGSVGCGEDPSSTAALTSVCLLAPSQESDLGDFGFCAELCDCDDDCENGDFVCDPLPEALQDEFGTVGSCTPPDSTVTGTPCSGPRPTRDAGATSDAAASDAATD